VHPTHSGVPQGGVVSPGFSNLVLDRWANYVEPHLIPAYTRGPRRRPTPPYVRLPVQASEARQPGEGQRVRIRRQQAPRIPSRAPHDPTFRRLWYVRSAAACLLGLSGPTREAVAIKPRLPAFLRDALPLERNADTTLVPQAHDARAPFLGYAVHVRQENSKHDHRQQRCMKGSMGLCVPTRGLRTQGAKYRRRGKPPPLPQRTLDDAYSIVAPYPAEGRGIVPYDRMAYNLHTLQALKHTMEVSLVKT
jgi:hypothetical protein